MLLFFRWQVATKSVFIRPLHPAFITTIWNYSNSWVKCWEKLYTRYPSFSVFCMTNFYIFCLSNNLLTKTLFVTQELPLFLWECFFPTQAEYSSFFCHFKTENIFVFYLKKKESIMILFALRTFLLCCIYGTNVLHVPFIKLSLALSIWL